MPSFIDPVIESINAFFAILSTGLKQTTESYCDIETADGTDTLVGRDGSLMTIIKVNGATALVGTPEFARMHAGLVDGLQTIP